jgi:carboxypeptidase Taq
MTIRDEYPKLLEAMSELADLAHAQALMGWDQETNMPPKGAQMRARSLGTLAGIYHDRLTAQSLVALVEDLKQADLVGDEAANVRELDREQARARKIPRELVVELSETASIGHEAWVQARAEDDFAHYQPWLEKMLRLKQQVAEIVGFEGSIYNALLDEYEPYATEEEIGPVFADLRRHLVRLVEGIAPDPRPGLEALERPFPVAQQEQFGRRIMEEMGFDLEAGRLDISVHPFCSGIGPQDVRLTTRYDENGFTQSLFGIIHETGHGLYEQGLPSELRALPAGRAVSLGIHESQSRLWENMIGRSREFWSHYLPELKKIFPMQLDGVDLNAFYRAINSVEPSLIRVEADEVTYNLHILLRFELESELLRGELPVADLPNAWNQRMEEYLGIRPANDTLGVLQDVHWSLGLFGYFPTYTLGNLYAAQLHVSAGCEIEDLSAQISRGDLLPLKSWLSENVHQRGSRLQAGALMREVTGKGLETEPFVSYLNEKFGSLYDLDL